MPNQILIVDDDATFNGLLTDIFEQAGHVVLSENSPEKALVRALKEPVDLLITDHRMPELTGRELFKRVRAEKPNLPIIIVSGFLSNANIRALIEEGIDGVYIKPLNVFSLLQQAESLINQARSGELGVHQRTLVEREGETLIARLPFSFSAFPCLNPNSEKFARKLFDLRHFKSSLVLIGEPGSPFRAICDDLAQFESEYVEAFEFFPALKMEESVVLERMEDAVQRGVGRLTFVVQEVTNLTAELRDRLFALLKREPPFDRFSLLSRLVFCCHQDIDALFDSGVIDDRLYVLMGSAELRIPPLRSLPDDVVPLAKRILSDISRQRSLGYMPQLAPGAATALVSMKWPGNVDQLKDLLTGLFDGDPKEVITPGMIDRSLRDGAPQISEAEFVQLLIAQKNRLLGAVDAMVNGKSERVQAILDYGERFADAGSPVSSGR